MKKLSLILALILALPARAFWFKPIIEISHDTANPELVLPMLEGKKYRIKFFNIDCPKCDTVLETSPELASALNIRTDLKEVSKNSLSTHHVIEVNKINEPIQGTIELKAIHGTFSKTIKVDLNTQEACDARD